MYEMLKESPEIKSKNKRSNCSLRCEPSAAAIYPKENKVESSEDQISNAGWSRKPNMRIREGNVVQIEEGRLAIYSSL